MFTDEQIQAMLEEAQEDTRQHMVEEIKRQTVSAVQYKLRDEIDELISKFVKEEVAPDLRAQLMANKDGILGVAVGSADDLASMLGKALIAALAENLGTSYKRKKILEAMFD